MENTIIYSLMALLVIALAAAVGYVIYLSKKVARLGEALATIHPQLHKQERDIGGLYTAGVNMDRLLIEHDHRLRACMEKIEALQEQDVESHPYHGAIEQLRKGADPQALVSEFGLSQSEAALLARLHSDSTANPPNTPRKPRKT